MNLTSKQKKIIIGSAAVLTIVGYLIYAGMRETMVYYMTVSEVLAKSSDLINENSGIRIGGKVAQNSIEKDSKNMKLKFEMEDDKTLEKLTILYEGVVPDTFKEGVTAIVEGKLSDNRTFSARTLLAKCPSKYEAKKK